MCSYHLTKTNCIYIKPIWHMLKLEPWTALHVQQLTVGGEILVARGLAPHSPHTSVAGVAAWWLHNLMHFKSDSFVTVHPVQADVSMIHLKHKVVGDTTAQCVNSVGPPKVGPQGLCTMIQPCDFSLQDPTARVENLINRPLIAVSLTINLQSWADHKYFGLVMHKTIICVVPCCWHVRSA